MPCASVPCLAVALRYPSRLRCAYAARRCASAPLCFAFALPRPASPLRLAAAPLPRLASRCRCDSEPCGALPLPFPAAHCQRSALQHRCLTWLGPCVFMHHPSSARLCLAYAMLSSAPLCLAYAALSYGPRRLALAMPSATLPRLCIGTGPCRCSSTDPAL